MLLSGSHELRVGVESGGVAGESWVAAVEALHLQYYGDAAG